MRLLRHRARILCVNARMTMMKSFGWHGFGDPAPAIGAGFTPDRFAYDMVRLAFLPWTMMEETSRWFATALHPQETPR